MVLYVKMDGSESLDWSRVAFFNKLHILDDSSLPIILELVLYTFLLNEPFPI